MGSKVVEEMLDDDAINETTAIIPQLEEPEVEAKPRKRTQQ